MTTTTYSIMKDFCLKRKFNLKRLHIIFPSSNHKINPKALYNKTVVPKDKPAKPDTTITNTLDMHMAILINSSVFCRSRTSKIQDNGDIQSTANSQGDKNKE